MPALLIITGTTRGIGAALARQAVAADHHVIGLSRTPGDAGETLLTHLTDLRSLPERIQSALAAVRGKSVDRWVLVNNAAIIAPIGASGDPDALDIHFKTNLSAPITLARAFVAGLIDNAFPKRIINLSSGASSKPFHGWSAYCASKAGLDHFGRCLAAEQATEAHPVDVLGFSPGVVDTGMQAQIRASSEADFPDVGRFHQLQSGGQLANPERVAEVLLECALSPRRYAGAVLRVPDLP